MIQEYPEQDVIEAYVTLSFKRAKEIAQFIFDSAPKVFKQRAL